VARVGRQLSAGRSMLQRLDQFGSSEASMEFTETDWRLSVLEFLSQTWPENKNNTLAA